MFIRNFEIEGGKEEISTEDFLERSKIFGKLGRCLVALETATKEELEAIFIKLPQKSNYRLPIIKLLGI